MGEIDQVSQLLGALSADVERNKRNDDVLFDVVAKIQETQTQLAAEMRSISDSTIELAKTVAAHEGMRLRASGATWAVSGLCGAGLAVVATWLRGKF